MTFATKADARAWLATQEADLTRGVLRQVRPEQMVLFADYFATWIAQRGLKNSTQALYRDLHTKFLAGASFDRDQVRLITPAEVRLVRTGRRDHRGRTPRSGLPADRGAGAQHRGRGRDPQGEPVPDQARRHGGERGARRLPPWPRSRRSPAACLSATTRWSCCWPGRGSGSARRPPCDARTSTCSTGRSGSASGSTGTPAGRRRSTRPRPGGAGGRCTSLPTSPRRCAPTWSVPRDR